MKNKKIIALVLVISVLLGLLFNVSATTQIADNSLYYDLTDAKYYTSEHQYNGSNSAIIFADQDGKPNISHNYADLFYCDDVGSQGLRVRSSKGGADVYSTGTEKITLEPNTRYILTTSVRTNFDSESDGNFRFEVANNGSYVESSRVLITFTNKKFKTYSTVFTTEDASEYDLTFRFNASSSKNATISSIEIIPVSDIGMYMYDFSSESLYTNDTNKYSLIFANSDGKANDTSSGKVYYHDYNSADSNYLNGLRFNASSADVDKAKTQLKLLPNTKYIMVAYARVTTSTTMNIGIENAGTALTQGKITVTATANVGRKYATVFTTENEVIYDLAIEIIGDNGKHGFISELVIIPESSLLINGDFETGDFGWLKKDATADTEILENRTNGGKKTLKLVGSATAPASVHTFVSVSAGETYKLQFDYTDNTSTVAKCEITEIVPDGTTANAIAPTLTKELAGSVYTLSGDSLMYTAQRDTVLEIAFTAPQKDSQHATFDNIVLKKAVLGDSNFDGKTDIRDMISMVNGINNGTSLIATDDLDKSSSVHKEDIVIMRNYLLGYIEQI